MIDINLVRDNADAVKNNLQKRAPDKLEILEKLTKNDKLWRASKQETDKLRQQRNNVSEQINLAKKEGKDHKSLLEQAKKIPTKLKELEDQQRSIMADQDKLLAQLPNMMHDSVPQGKDASDNPTIRTWGKPREFEFEPKNHVEILEELRLVDFEASARVSGSGFYFLESSLALLNQALIRFAIDFMSKKGYRYVETPLLIEPYVLDAAMDTTAIKDSIYKLKDENLCLIGTSEHSLLGRYSNHTFIEQELPARLFSYSMCFRREIGSHGINEKGLWRTHQFNKVEQFIFCRPDQSHSFYEELLTNSEEIMKTLNLPYRIVECCSGDLAAWKAKSADVEVWRPTTKTYGEVMSLSNCTDYQARDLNIKLVKRDGTRQVVHTLNNTALATSRIIVAIIENNQQKDGTVTIPDVLVPYMQGITKLS